MLAGGWVGFSLVCRYRLCPLTSVGESKASHNSRMKLLYDVDSQVMRRFARRCSGAGGGKEGAPCPDFSISPNIIRVSRPSGTAQSQRPDLRIFHRHPVVRLKFSISSVYQSASRVCGETVGMRPVARSSLALCAALGMIRSRKKGCACIYGSTCSSWVRYSPRAVCAAVP